MLNSLGTHFLIPSYYPFFSIDIDRIPNKRLHNTRVSDLQARKCLMRAVFLSLCFWFVRQCGCWWEVRISLVVVQVIASKQAVDYSSLAENPGSFYGDSALPSFCDRLFVSRNDCFCLDAAIRFWQLRWIDRNFAARRIFLNSNVAVFADNF